MRNFLLFLTVLLSISPVFAINYDFNKSGDTKANEILKEYITNKIPEFEGDVVGYFHDINEDNKNEIIGIVKSNLFYSLAGYKLVVLKENNSTWETIKNDIYFDITQSFEIENKKITYYHTIFYKNKKYTAKIKNNKITTNLGFLDVVSDKKAQNIEEITKLNETNERNDFIIEQFKAQNQRSVDINYKNLNDRTKHYLELK